MDAIEMYRSCAVLVMLKSSSQLLLSKSTVNHHQHELFKEAFNSTFLYYFQCDGQKLDLLSGPNLEGIAILNIPSVYGGANLWGEVDKKKKRLKDAGSKDVNSMSQGKKNDLNFGWQFT